MALSKECITASGRDSYVIFKEMRELDNGNLAPQTTVEIYGVELSLADLRGILKEAEVFDEQWRSALGMSPSGLKRIGTI